MAERKTMDLKECTLIFQDGTPTTPNELTVDIDEGNITWTETYNVEPKLNRGLLDYIKAGDEAPMQVSLEFRFATLRSSSGDPVSPYEFATKTNGASGYLTTGNACDPYAFNIIVEVNGNCGTTIQDEIITFPDFAKQEIGGDIGAGQFSMSGICNAIRPTSVRTVLA
jgi:hypothetical protein